MTSADTNRDRSDAWPDQLEKSCALLVGAKSPRFGIIGSGVYFRVADIHFLISAAHIFREAELRGLTIGIGCDNNGFLALRNHWYAISLESFEAFEDSVDLAIYPLDERELQKLTGVSFLRMSDVGAARPNGIYTVVGYPGVFGSERENFDVPLPLRALALTVPAYDGSTRHLDNFSSQDSILLSANSDMSTGADSSSMRMSDLSNNAQNTLSDIGGMSGGPVWLVATSGTNPSTWSREMPRLIGVQIGVFLKSDLLRVTKWTRVIDLIRLAWPELASSLEILQG